MPKHQAKIDHIDPDKLTTEEGRAIYDMFARYVEQEKRTENDRKDNKRC